MSAANELEKYLGALLDKTDPIFKSFLANSAGVPDVNPQHPQQLNQGAAANMLQWNRLLGQDLIKQMDWSQATQYWQDFTLHKHIGLVRYQGESNEDYAARVRDFIVAPKSSKGAIIFYLSRFSSPGPAKILDGQTDSAFADVSYADWYTKFRETNPASPYYLWWIQPAIAVTADGNAFFFILELENTPVEDIPKVLDYLKHWVAAGIGYEVHIVSV